MRLKSNSRLIYTRLNCIDKAVPVKMKYIIGLRKMSRKRQTCKYCDVMIYCCLSIRDRKSCDINKQTNKQPSRCFIILVTSKPRSMISRPSAVSLNFDLTPYKAYTSMDTNNSNIHACLVIIKSTAHKWREDSFTKVPTDLNLKRNQEYIFMGKSTKSGICVVSKMGPQ